MFPGLLAPLLLTLATAPPELSGLWSAKRWYNYGARGSLLITRDPSARDKSTFTAELEGRVLPVQEDKGELSFKMPNHEGSFRGKLLPDHRTIAGHWYPPIGRAMAGVYISPVRLEAAGKNRWRGNIVPFDDTFTYYLLAKKRPDHSYDVFLRNPERDQGAQIGADRLVLEGSTVRLLGKQELSRGSYDAATDSFTLTFASRGGTYDFRREGDESNFYPRGKSPARYTYRPPPERDDGWPTGTLEAANIDRPAIEKFIQSILDTPMQSIDTPEIHGILIARNGKLVLEEYFHGEHRDKLHETRSAAKTVTALLAGAAIHAGEKIKLSTPVYETMGAEIIDPRQKLMTLEHLLTMSGGYFCDDTNPQAPGNEEVMLDQELEPNYYRHTLKIPMAAAPGESTVYCSADPNLALGVLGRATGKDVLELFDRLLGGPMQIERYGWFTDPSLQPYGGGGVHFLPRDFMKFGQLMLDGGTWKSRRLLDRDFVERAGSPLHRLRNIGYGYLVWVNDYPYKDRTVRAYFAGGAGGQTAIVIRELGLVIATFGGNYSSVGTSNTSQNLPVRYILPAVREKGDDPKAPVVFREDYVTPYGKSAQNEPKVSPKP